MTISGFTANSPLPGLAPQSVTLAGSNPLLALSTGASQLGAASGVTERPGIGARVVSAMKAAIAELRGNGASEEQIRHQVLAMQAQQPVTLARKPVTKPASSPRTAKSVKSAVTAKTWKTLASTPPVAAALPTAQATGPQAPMNQTQLPGATMYSYDQHGNPAPASQSLDPRMLHGISGLAQAADPEGRQMNATNQTALNGASGGVPLVAGPVLGAPITLPGTVAPGVATGATGANQSVTNRNATDIANRNEGPGYGYGSSMGLPFDPTGGMATPYSPYGASMTGAYGVGQQRPGILGRIFG